MKDEYANDPSRPLVEAFSRRRDETSFRRLYRAFSPLLFGFALRMTRHRGEAEDLVQETWCRAVARHDTFARNARYGSWLMGILLNCQREAARRRSREGPAADGEQSDAVADPLSAHPALHVDLERALAALPSGYREIVILHDVNGHTHQEIAAMLGISDGTSKSQLARGRALLRAWLGEGEGQRERADDSGPGTTRETPDEP